jgi:hypothetical protein
MDGAYSCSSGSTPQGVCSSNGGPRCYVCPGPWCGQTPVLAPADLAAPGPR